MSTVLTTGDAPRARADARVLRVSSHIVEVLSDPGEGAQKCGQLFGIVSAKMGNGVWTVEIIPAEIQPPPRDPAGASGNRIRIGSGPVTNWGDATDVVIAFNEQVLLGRHRLGALAPEAVVLLENRWATHADERIRNEWLAAREELSETAYRIIEMPMEAECLQVVDDASKGRNMFALGVLACIYQRDLHSYRDLPIRYAEQGLVHRHEPSGTLHGLLRVRHITQDDAHVFCREDQIEEEVVRCLDFGFFIYDQFGFKPRLELSTRPEKRVGSDEA